MYTAGTRLLFKLIAWHDGKTLSVAAPRASVHPAKVPGQSTRPRKTSHLFFQFIKEKVGFIAFFLYIVHPIFFISSNW